LGGGIRYKKGVDRWVRKGIFLGERGHGGGAASFCKTKGGPAHEKKF